jgi:hypothetical protein
METSRPPTGLDIWQALKEELKNNLYPLPSSTLAPTVYHVYLHPEDFEVIEGIVPRIVGDIAGALTKEVERQNQAGARRGPLRSLLRGTETGPPIEVPAAGWEIYIRPDQDAELAQGALGIVSKLTMPSRPEYGGTPTVRTVKTVVSSDGHRSSTVSNGQEPAAPAPAIAASGGASGSPAPPSTAATMRPPTLPRATLSYTDEAGDHVFIMRKDMIKIGRGGSDAWVDVQLITGPKVSREHCWILRGSRGGFVIRDASTWGTSVDGEPIPAPVRSPEGLVVEPGAEKPLPAKTRIDLADALSIDFCAEHLE